MPYLKKVIIKGNEYFYLFHTVREGGKFRKLSRYLGKEKPPGRQLDKLKQAFLRQIKGRHLALKEEKRPRVSLLGALKELQRKHGYLPEAEIRELSNKLNLPVVEIYDAASFYSMFTFKKKGTVIRLCSSLPCYLNGSLNILEEIRKILKIDVNQTTKDGRFTLELTSCIGCCDKAPAIMLDEELITNVTKEKLKQLLK